MFQHTPNRLTLVRVLLAPVFIALFVAQEPWSLWAALAVALIVEITDVLDGHLARRHNQVSDVGKFFDPFADSVSRFSEFLAFFAVSQTAGSTLEGMMPLWMIVVIFYRDVLVAYLRIGGATRNIIISARFTGKLKAVVQGIVANVIVFLAAAHELLGIAPATVRTTGFWMLVVVTAVTFYSGVDYVWGNRRLLKTDDETVRR